MNVAASGKVITFVYSRDRGKARTFYVDVLGFRQTDENQFATVLDLNGIRLHITQIDDHVPTAHPVIGWEVADLVATINDLRARCVNMNIYPGFGQDELGIWSSPDGKSRIAFFNDPEGNGLMLSQA
jgi:catechol-2,3-dioxygenase